MNDTSVINIAYFAKTPEIRDAVLLSSKIRNMTLDRCYAIPGYATLTNEEKLRIYDTIRDTVTKELKGE